MYEEVLNIQRMESSNMRVTKERMTPCTRRHSVQLLRRPAAAVQGSVSWTSAAVAQRCLPTLGMSAATLPNHRTWDQHINRLIRSISNKPSLSGRRCVSGGRTRQRATCSERTSSPEVRAGGKPRCSRGQTPQCRWGGSTGGPPSLDSGAVDKAELQCENKRKQGYKGRIEYKDKRNTAVKRTEQFN